MNWRSFILRTLRMIFLLWFIISIVFFLKSAIPQDEALTRLTARGIQAASQQDFSAIYEKEKKSLGLDLPLFYFGISNREFAFHGTKNQYHNFFSAFLHLDFGTSYVNNQSVIEQVLSSFKITFIVVFMSICFIGLIAYYLAQSTSFLTQVFDLFYFLPSFLLAILMVVFLSNSYYGLAFFDTSPLPTEATFLQLIGKVSPIIICNVLGATSYYYYLLRSAMDGERGKMYILGAKAKGLSDKEVKSKHLLPNARNVFLMSLVDSIPSMLLGSIFLENTFNVAGMGRLLYNAFINADWQLVYGIVFFVACCTIFTYTVQDLFESRHQLEYEENSKFG